MVVRVAVVAAGILAAGAAVGGPLSARAGRRFVVGKTFAYTCFEGARGPRRLPNDGSVIGTMQSRGNGPVKYAMMPPGTLHVRGQTVCANVRGMPFEPCFNLEKTSESSFRGSVSGLGFAYCDFTRRSSPPVRTTSTWRARPSQPTPLDPPSVAKSTE